MNEVIFLTFPTSDVHSSQMPAVHIVTDSAGMPTFASLDIKQVVEFIRLNSTDTRQYQTTTLSLYGAILEE